MLRNKTLLLGALSACFATAASAAPDVYDVTVNTSSISGTSGSLDFSFNPGPLVTQAASVEILGFSSDASLSSVPSTTGDVTGVLPATVTFDNGSAFNDYFTGFTFGTTLAFQVHLFGPALSTPDGVSTSGSALSFSMFSDAAGTLPALTTDTTDGFALTVDVNLDGSTTADNFSSQLSLGPSGSVVPEPHGAVLLATVMLFSLIASRRRRSLRRS
jgi:hypothetical protein